MLFLGSSVGLSLSLQLQHMSLCCIMDARAVAGDERGCSGCRPDTSLLERPSTGTELQMCDYGPALRPC